MCSLEWSSRFLVTGVAVGLLVYIQKSEVDTAFRWATAGYKIIVVGVVEKHGIK